MEAIRLAADFSSRKLLSEQKRDRRDSLAVTPASASRMRIRAILDKQKTLKVSSSPALTSVSRVDILSFQEDEEKSRREKRESQDISKFLWVYR